MRAHIPAALRLCRVAGWNQVYEDWQRLADYEPEGCFVAVNGADVVGTVTTTRYGTALAWIGMMLVDLAYRRRGVGTLLMRQALHSLHDCGVRCIKLDATPEGNLVYQRLGFHVEWEFQRWTWETSRNRRDETMDVQDSGSLTLSLRDLDREAFGGDRGDYLTRLGQVSRVATRDDGFGMLRPGFLASYLGPVTANSLATARSIIDELLNDLHGVVFWDIPRPQPAGPRHSS